MFPTRTSDREAEKDFRVGVSYAMHLWPGAMFAQNENYFNFLKNSVVVHAFKRQRFLSGITSCLYNDIKNSYWRHYLNKLEGNWNKKIWKHITFAHSSIQQSLNPSDQRYYCLKSNFYFLQYQCENSRNCVMVTNYVGFHSDPIDKSAYLKQHSV
jgi:hypothetical protein